MSRYWPHDTRFSADNFGDQPVWLILQALDQGAKLQRDELHMQELGISSLCALFVNANRDPKKGKPAKPADFYRFKDADNKLPAIACDAFFSLVDDRKIPGWAVGSAPLDELRRDRLFNPVRKPRALVGEGILLLCPRINDSEISAAMAIVDSTGGIIEVYDVDNNQRYNVLIDEVEEADQAYWVVDFNCEAEAVEG